MAVRIREVMARPWIGVCVPLALIYWQLLIHLPRACHGRTAVLFPANSSPMSYVELALDEVTSAVRGFVDVEFPRSLTQRLYTLVVPNKSETSVCGCHCPREMAVRVHEVMARPWVGVCLPLALSLHYFHCNRIKFNLFFINYCIS